MARGKFDPRDFGIEMDRDALMDQLADEFNDYVRGTMAFDELLLHPREALAFCDDVRRRHGWFYVPDDIILRSIMTRRKNPSS